MSVSSSSERDGPRERLSTVGARALSDAELLALVLGTGTAGEPVLLLATRLLAELDGLDGLAREGSGELAARRGLGASRAARLIAALELGRRLCARPLSRASPIRSSHDVAAWVGPRLVDAEVEEVLALAVDSKNRPIGEVLVARGGLTQCPFAPGDAFRALLRLRAAGAIFVHNHPSGEPSPSAADRAVTERLRRAGELLGVPVLDHVIVGREGHFSFLDAGLLGGRATDA